MNSITKEIFYVSVFTLTLLALLFWNIIATYAYTDSYEFILNAHNENFINVFIQGGRLLYGVLIKSIFVTLASVESLKYVRLVSFFGGFALLITLYRVLKFYNIKSIYALSIIVLFACCPSFNIIIIWSATFQVTWALLLALIAGFLAVEFKRVAAVTGSILLGVVALNLYQPAYTFFIIPVFLKWVASKDGKLLIMPLLVHVITYALYYFIYKAYLYGFDLSSLGRSGISLKFLEAITYFFTDLFEIAARSNLIFAPKFWRGFATTLVIALMLFYHFDFNTLNKKYYSKVINNLIVVLGFLIVSMLPNLISDEKWVAFRTMNTLFLLVIIHIVFGLRKVLKNYHHKLQLTLLIVIMIGSFTSSYYNINRGFIAIQTAEFSIIKSKIAAASHTFSQIYIKPATMNALPDMGYIKRVVTDEYGRFSSSSSWVPIPIVKMALGQEERGAIKVEIYQDQIVSKNELLIDIEKEFKNYYIR
ncbi:MAG: hypothetical protein RLO81_11400 [Fulvivirga sp.]|uniref:glucosyltransferase domain-containing protein n=1 Tax=Fulvivirga sp. TaxID=1931237 RepID=UPI0032EFBDC4